MAIRRILALLALPAALAAARCDAYDAPAEPGPHAVEAQLDTWHDDARDRHVPVKLYLPDGAPAPWPIAIVSHGLGGSREGYAYLGRHLASHGYLALHLQHLGSDDAVWRGQADPMAAMRAAKDDPRNALERPRDVSFAIDRLEALAQTEAWRDKLDLDRIAIAGHSFGAYTALAVAGTVAPVGRRDLTQRDERVKAALIMSPTVNRPDADLDRMYGSIAIPCLHMTGTEDTSPLSPTTAEQRRLPFDHIHLPDQYLLTFTGGDHMVFSGRGRMAGGENDARFQALIRRAALAFFDGYLRDDADARGWLAGFGEVLGEAGVWEVKAGEG